MSQHAAEAAYRARIVSTAIAGPFEGQTVIRVTRTYDTIGAARGQATQAKNLARGDRVWDTVVTVERATGWEIV